MIWSLTWRFQKGNILTQLVGYKQSTSNKCTGEIGSSPEQSGSRSNFKLAKHLDTCRWSYHSEKRLVSWHGTLVHVPLQGRLSCLKQLYTAKFHLIYRKDLRNQPPPLMASDGIWWPGNKFQLPANQKFHPCMLGCEVSHGSILPTESSILKFLEQEAEAKLGNDVPVCSFATVNHHPKPIHVLAWW